MGHADKRKQIMMNKKQKAKEAEIKEMPINKGFLQAVDEKGIPLYLNASKLMKWKLAGIDDTQDIMRQIAAFIDNIRFSRNLEKKYGLELETEVFVSKNKHGIVMSKEELYAAKVASRINQFQDLSMLRIQLSDKLLIQISEDVFTGKMYNEYLDRTEKVINSLGFELFPSEMEIIWPE